MSDTPTEYSVKVQSVTTDEGVLLDEILGELKVLRLSVRDILKELRRENVLLQELIYAVERK